MTAVPINRFYRDWLDWIESCTLVSIFFGLEVIRSRYVACATRSTTLDPVSCYSGSSDFSRLRSTRGCTGNFDGGSRLADCSSIRDRCSEARVVSRDRMVQSVAINWHCVNSS